MGQSPFVANGEIRGSDNDARRRIKLHAVQFLQKSPTIQDRQKQIQQNDGWRRLALEILQGLLPVTDDVNAVSLAAQHHRQAFARYGVIFNNEDSFHAVSL